jgi:DNA polymerase elongation subunit (family B)
MYTYFRRDFNFSSYKLDDVAGQLISDDIKMMKHTYDNIEDLNPITELYTQNIMGLHVGDFIHLEITTFTSNYLRDGHKYPVLDIIRGREVVEMVKGVEQTNTYNIICIAGHEELDMTKHVKWGMAKDDVSPQDIFRLTVGSSADRARVAKYCIQDCNLVHHLMNKIDVLTGYIEMSKICSVPISFLVFRGQGIKLTSYVAKKCREKNTLMPDLDRSNDFDGYEGAIVLPPKCSMYMDNPVACVDYASLYPSSMISQNYSHDSKVWTKEYDLEGGLVKETGEKDRAGRYIYDNLPEYQYIDVKFDAYKYMRNPAKPAAKAEKTKVGWTICRWAQLPNDQKSIMPAILEELLKARAATRKMAKTEKDPFMQNILDKRQLGYKVTANSLYGQCGARTSTFYEKDVAASTTATGRAMIIYAKKIIENVYGDLEYETKSHGPVLTKAEYVYGDSVANYTPVIVRVTNAREIVITTIEELATKYGGSLWKPGKQEKEFCELVGVESWTEAGWTKLHRVIRHTLAPHKKMIRVLTHTGLVDVTDDHSLVRADGTEVSPKDVAVGTELLHHSCREYADTSDYTRYTRTTRHKYFETMVDAAKYTNYLHSQYIPYIIHCNNQSNEIAVYLTSVGEPNNTVRRLDTIPYAGYVYDLTTENHHFAAGVGNLIVHNTDSVFFTFNLVDPASKEPIRGKKALEITIEIAQDAAHLCTKFLKAPMELAYEKTMMPFILLSKKRYVGMLYETDANKGKMKYMGLSIKRRDSCDYLKDTYGEILNILMKEHNVDKAIQYLTGAMGDLVAGNVPMDKLTLTKALRGYYKNPQTIAHSVLADRIGQRDPGNKPKPGDRMKFAFIVNPKPKALLGEKIETPEYIVQNKMTLDYTYYITNQLMKPLQQLFGLALEDIWAKQNKRTSINAYKKEMAKLAEEYGDDLETFMKKKEKYCAAKVKQLLFDSTLEKIYNKKHGIQTLDTVFSKTKR